MKYDFIIAGAGCAGLSLLYRILSNEQLSKSSILVVDKDDKTKNDRTWCYWEEGEGLFEDIVFHKWPTLIFRNSEFTKECQLEKYRYKMIKGLKFYDHVLSYARSFENVVFANEEIVEMHSSTEGAVLSTKEKKYEASYIFNSTPIFYPEMSRENTLLQHFEGWEIKTKNPRFDPSVGTLMDFSLSQEHGTTFMYVLPTSETEALVEYTLFSPATLKKEEYARELKTYISETLGIESYEITHKEFGVIPMSLARFSPLVEGHDRIVNIGTAGGHTKASTGYTFQFVQEKTAQIVDQLVNHQHPLPKKTWDDKKFEWYDRTLLQVLLDKKMEGKQIFSSMFKKIEAEDILAFLANDSTPLMDLKVMTSVPTMPFLVSGFKQL
jgi:lycopene beta-cyclase